MIEAMSRTEKLARARGTPRRVTDRLIESDAEQALRARFRFVERDPRDSPRDRRASIG